ncbi:MAG: SDR family oxidoreductase [Chloroflexota bacterium]
MTQKTVFISGATSGIGLATAKQLLAEGWIVYAGGLDSDDFSVLRDGIRRLPFDITDEQAVENAFSQLASEIGRLDALVNNAGIQLSGPIEGLSMAQIRQQMEVNLFGHVQVTKATLPLLRKASSARIVNVSSLMGQVTMPMLGAYSMSKHALEAFSDVLRIELASSGIHVAVVEPGAIKTPMSNHAYDGLVRVRDNSPAEIQERYKAYFDGMLKTLQSQQTTATSPETIAKVIVHALTNQHPKARYAIGMDVKGLSTIRKIIPERLGDWILLRALGIKG